MALPRSALSRRGFLAGTSAFAATGFGVWSGVAFGREAPRVGDDAWQKLANQLDGWLIRPNDQRFDAFSRPYNLRFDGTRPAGIAVCANSADIAKAIRWSRDNKVTFVARGGGHSYAGFSTTTGLIIDVSLMNETVFDPKEGTVRVGAGARNQTIYDALRRVNVAITHGRCATVGAAGFLLGGGIGFNMRANGLACDQMVDSEIVLADGTVLAIKQQTKDEKERDPRPTRLFWACRGGGGGNFGINTSFTLQTFAAPPVCVFEINWDKKTEAVFEALMPALEAGPRTLGTRFSCRAITRQEHLRGKEFTINLIGQLQRGRESDVRDILKPALDASKPSYQFIREMPYWQGQAFLEDRGGPARFHERSAFLIKGIDKDARKTAVEYLRDWRSNELAKADLRFFQTGGKIDDLLPNATAFVHRQRPWILDIGISWPEGTSESTINSYRGWQDAFYREMLGDRKKPSAKGAFVNFVDLALENPQAAYYGDNLTELEDIKYEFDRDNVFKFTQSIAPKRRP